ncbi:MAG TPA: DUF6491 family protein [Gammaproteobacteria bacterium]
MKRAKKDWILAILVTVLAACATVSDVPSLGEMLRQATGQNGRACVRSTEIRNYGTLKDDLVIIRGLSKHYVAVITPGCMDLDSPFRTRFRGGHGEICGGSMDSIITETDECIIRQMFEFEDREHAFITLHSVLEERENLKNM